LLNYKILVIKNLIEPGEINEKEIKFMANSLNKHNLTAEGDLHFKMTGRAGGRPSLTAQSPEVNRLFNPSYSPRTTTKKGLLRESKKKKGLLRYFSNVFMIIIIGFY